MKKLNWSVTPADAAGFYLVTSYDNPAATPIAHEKSIDYQIKVEAGTIMAWANKTKVYDYIHSEHDYYFEGLKKFDRKFTALLQAAKNECEIHYANRGAGKLNFAPVGGHPALFYRYKLDRMRTIEVRKEPEKWNCALITHASEGLSYKMLGEFTKVEHAFAAANNRFAPDGDSVGELIRRRGLSLLAAVVDYLPASAPPPAAGENKAAVGQLPAGKAK